VPSWSRCDLPVRRRRTSPEEGSTKIRDYEITYILDPALPDEEVTALKERFSQLAQGQGAELTKLTQWDRRRLAYPIRNKRDGIYVIMELRAEPAAVQEVARQLKLTEAVLRHIVVRRELPPPRAEKREEGEDEGR
jgi:small subunit ribosomal protein S6